MERIRKMTKEGANEPVLQPTITLVTTATTLKTIVLYKISQLTAKNDKF